MDLSIKAGCALCVELCLEVEDGLECGFWEGGDWGGTAGGLLLVCGYDIEEVVKTVCAVLCDMELVLEVEDSEENKGELHM